MQTSLSARYSYMDSNCHISRHPLQLWDKRYHYCCVHGDDVRVQALHLDFYIQSGTHRMEAEGGYSLYGNLWCDNRPGYRIHAFSTIPYITCYLIVECLFYNHQRSDLTTIHNL